MIILIFCLMFGVCFGAFWLAIKPSSRDKRTEKRLRELTRSVSTGIETRPDAGGLLRPAMGDNTPAYQRTSLWQNFQKLLSESNAGQTPKQILLWSLGSGFALGFVFFIFMPVPLLALGLACVGTAAPVWRLKFLRTRRVNKFEAVLPDALDLMARALRSGHAVSAAIEVVGDQGREPVATEFRSLFQQQSFGLPFRDALETMMKRIPSVDLQFAGTAMLVQKETGGNLAEILDRTVEIMRERVRIRGEVRTKTAQGKLTGIILALLPVVMLLIISMTNPEYAKNLTATETGHKMLYVSAGMITIGWLFIRKIVNIEI